MNMDAEIQGRLKIGGRFRIDRNTGLIKAGSVVTVYKIEETNDALGSYYAWIRDGSSNTMPYLIKPGQEPQIIKEE